MTTNAHWVLVGKPEGKRLLGKTRSKLEDNIVTDLNNALPGNSSVNTVQHRTVGEAVFFMSSAPSSGGTTRF
jgi:hypothetical protein